MLLAIQNISIQASDSLNSDVATVVVTIEDINDVRPNFTESVYVASIIENVPPGSSITTVIANDDDTGESGVVTYGVVDGDIAVFEVDCKYSIHQTVLILFRADKIA